MVLTILTSLAVILVMLLLFRLYMKGASCTSSVKMEGKTVIITGANTGIGFETARDLLQRGARVVFACRDVNKAKCAVQKIMNSDSDRVLVEKLDLSSFDSIRTFCENIKRHISTLDVLINNAGVCFHPYTKTEDGLEMHMSVNYFGHFLLTHLLLELLEKSESPRIVFVGSMVYKHGKIDLINMNKRDGFSSFKAYCDSKLAVALFCREFKNQMSDTNINIYHVHPGVVSTEIGRHINSSFIVLKAISLVKMLMKTSKEGCQTVVYCTISEETKGESGYHYRECCREEWARLTEDRLLAKQLWDHSKKVTGLID
ncbi:retinol dehydrogenase 14-like [Argonauta hians]